MTRRPMCVGLSPLALLALLAGSSAVDVDRRLVFSYDGSDRQVDWARFAEVFPYLVSVQWMGTHYCGGTLIRDNWVLSAAHCFYTAKAQAANYEVWSLANRQAGSWNKTAVDLIVVHPEYDMESLDHDIVLLRLATPLPDVQLVKLESSSARHNGSQALLAGWGSIDEACQKYEFILKEGDSQIVGREPCAKHGQFFNWSERICAEHINATGTDMAGAGCGDSGGPLFVTDGNDLTQVGIVSYTAVGRDVFTRVFSYQGWIDQVVSSPPSDHQMIPPNCYGQCCDDPEYLDRWNEECWTWRGLACDEAQIPYAERAELMDKCKASCMRCPICEATNSSCCDTLGFKSGQGHACTQWAGFDCNIAVSQYGYSDAEMEALIRNCPFSCARCSAGTDCTDTAYFKDPYGYKCVDWQGYDCTQAVEVFSYAAQVEDMVLKHCPMSCGTCTPTTVTSTSSEPGSASSTLTQGEVSGTGTSTSSSDDSLSSSISASHAVSAMMAGVTVTLLVGLL